MKTEDNLALSEGKAGFISGSDWRVTAGEADWQRLQSKNTKTSGTQTAYLRRLDQTLHLSPDSTSKLLLLKTHHQTNRLYSANERKC